MVKEREEMTVEEREGVCEENRLLGTRETRQSRWQGTEPQEAGMGDEREKKKEEGGTVCS